MTVNKDITIFNCRLDKATRRNVFIPTNIHGVSFYDVRGSNVSNGDQTEKLSFTIRIPVDARTENDRRYIEAAKYRKLADGEAEKHWTIQHGDYILAGTIAVAGEWIFDEFNFRSGVITEKEITEMLGLRKFNGDFITVVEYADNTTRGSKAVKHWRIGGA